MGLGRGTGKREGSVFKYYFHCLYVGNKTMKLWHHFFFFFFHYRSIPNGDISCLDSWAVGKLVPIAWDLLFLDVCSLVPLKLSAIGVLNGGVQSKSSGKLQKPSALFPSQISSGEMGGGEVVLVVTFLRQMAILKCTFQF